MNDPQQLLARLNQIGQSLAQLPTALALIGMGSVGASLNRLDEFSDLDFFVIVKPGSKAQYLQDLSWLSRVAPVAYHFANTVDGYKLLYEDGIFCEFAVFEAAELPGIPFAPGRMVWKAPGVNDRLAIPHATQRPTPTPHPTAWLLGEALTNLYIGLLRDHRGEILSATHFIQQYAVDRVLDLAEQVEIAATVEADPFNRARRYERRYPKTAQLLPTLMPGYGRNREAARAALTFLNTHFEVNPTMARLILELCDPD